MLYKTLIRPILTYGNEFWPLSKKDGNTLWIFERRLIYSPVNENGVRRTRYNSELYTLYNESDIVKVDKIGRLRWLGRLLGMQESDPCRKLTLLKPEGT
jgi:hypothetical protein